MNVLPPLGAAALDRHVHGPSAAQAALKEYLRLSRPVRHVKRYHLSQLGVPGGVCLGRARDADRRRPRH
eukprot:2956069-Rhodomonas_salina.1